MSEIADASQPPVIFATLMDQAKSAAGDDSTVQEPECSAWSDQSGILHDIVRPL